MEGGERAARGVRGLPPPRDPGAELQGRLHAGGERDRYGSRSEGADHRIRGRVRAGAAPAIHADPIAAVGVTGAPPVRSGTLGDAVMSTAPAPMISLEAATAA